MGVVMHHPRAYVDWGQFIAQVREAPFKKRHCQRRFPGTWRRSQHGDPTRKRHSRSVHEVQVWAAALERDGQTLVKVPQQCVRVLDVSDHAIEVANIEALRCVGALNLVAPCVYGAQPRKGDYQGAECYVN